MCERACVSVYACGGRHLKPKQIHRSLYRQRNTPARGGGWRQREGGGESERVSWQLHCKRRAPVAQNKLTSYTTISPFCSTDAAYE